jgi:hypothetical protein
VELFQCGRSSSERSLQEEGHTHPHLLQQQHQQQEQHATSQNQQQQNEQQQQQQEQHATSQNQPAQGEMRPQAWLCSLSVDWECVLPEGAQQPSEQEFVVGLNELHPLIVGAFWVILAWTFSNLAHEC